MNTTTLSAQRPHVILQNEAIEISEGNKKFRFSLQEISKMCLRPCKSNYFTSLLETMLLMHERMYHLCITTTDGREVTIRIKGHHKQTYVNLISLVRRNIQKGIHPSNSFPVPVGLN